MTKKTLYILAAALLILGGVYLLVLGGQRPQAGEGEKQLLSALDSDKIARIVLESGPDKVELESKDGRWVLSARAGYPANKEKVNAFLLKVFDLSTSQEVPADEEGIKKLGLDDEGVKAGRAAVRFYDKEGKELGGVHLGELRKQENRGPNNFAMASGQFVRETGSSSVYLIPLPLTVSTSVSNWLDTAVADVLQSQIYAVAQESSEQGVKKPEFELTRDDGAQGEAATKDLQLKGDIAPEEELQRPVLSQVASGLENLTLSDVKQAAPEELAKLNFDKTTTYKVKNGLVYTVTTAQNENKIFARISVAYNQELADELKAWAERINAVEAEKEKAAEAAKAEAKPEEKLDEKAQEKKDEQPSPADEKGKQKEQKPKVQLQLSSDQEAQKLNASYDAWLYDLASYQGDKFRKGRADLVKPKEKKDEKQEAAEAAPEEEELEPLEITP